jgi:hypothetical protein
MHGYWFSDLWNAFLPLGFSGEICGVLTVLREFAAEYNVVPFGTEDFGQRGDVELIGSVYERVCSLLGILEGPRPWDGDSLSRLS